jgi:hypothetical protein
MRGEAVSGDRKGTNFPLSLPLEAKFKMPNPQI